MCPERTEGMLRSFVGVDSNEEQDRPDGIQHVKHDHDSTSSGASCVTGV